MSSALDRAHEELVRLKRPYEQAKAMIESPVWGLLQRQVLDRIILLTKDRNETAEKVLGRIAECVRPIEEQQNAITLYESKKKSIELLEGDS